MERNESKLYFRSICALLLTLSISSCQVAAHRVNCPVSGPNGKKPHIFHKPPLPQIRQAPIPIYAEVQQGAGIDKVYLYYQGTGMDAFERVQMVPYDRGFAYSISCKKVWEPRVYYYIIATGGSCVLATAGTAESPLEADVVTTLDAGGPALPGFHFSPGACIEIDCPPGVPEEECEHPLYRAQGEECENDRDCQPGIECRDEICSIVAPYYGDGPDLDARGARKTN